MIGQVENLRPGKAGYDSVANTASNTSPSGVFFQTAGGSDGSDDHFGDHATGVANVMIGQTASLTGQTAANYPEFEGVAPGAFLYATASGDFDHENLVASLNRMALISGGNAAAINMSFVTPIEFPSGPNGSSYLSLFLDWSARQHDVLYVAAWGNDNQEFDRSPADMLNGIVVGASMKPQGQSVWRKFSDKNSTHGFGENGTETMHIDFLAPGKDIRLLETGDTVRTFTGTSYSAPLVTGSVALLQQYASQQISGPNPRFNLNSKKHQVMKVIMMNSADKLTGVQGSARTAVDAADMTWLQSEAFNNPSIVLDDRLGTGLLNVDRAITQFAPGEYNPGAIPAIGWDYGLAPDANDSVEYTFTANGGDYLSVTLAYDRPVFCTCFNQYETGAQFLAETFPDLNIYIQQMDGTIVDSSTSSLLTVEHIFTNALPAGQYKIVVKHEFDAGEKTNYALAWWFGAHPGLAGDHNRDNAVDAADYVLWRKDPEKYGGDPGGYEAWRANYGNVAGNGLSSVPEPSGLFLLVLGVLFIRNVRVDR